MSDVSIWPLKSNGKVVKVSPDLYTSLARVVNEFSVDPVKTPTTREAMWEFARRILEAGQEDQARKDRHARGDFTLELNDLEGHVSDLNERLDGKPFQIGHDIIAKVNDCQSSGFNAYDASALNELTDKLLDEMTTTDAMATEVAKLVKKLRGLL